MCLPFLECTVHRTPETPCASCCLIVSRWLLMSSRAMLLLVLIAHSGRCAWNKYAGHPSKWKRFPSWVAPGLLWSIQHCNISLGQDPIWQIIVLQGLCSEHTCIETYWNATCWNIQAVLLCNFCLQFLTVLAMTRSPLTVASVISRDTAHSKPPRLPVPRIGAEANKDPNIHEQSCQFPCSTDTR